MPSLAVRLCAVLLAVVVAGAWIPATANPAPEQRAFLDLRVNGVDEGHVLVIVDGDDVLVAPKSLEDAGIHGIDGRHLASSLGDTVSLNSAAPALTYSLDANALTLSLTVDAHHLTTTSIALHSEPRAAAVDTRSKSAFLNYAVTASQGNKLQLTTETGVRAFGGLLHTTLAAGGYGSGAQANMTFDDVARLRRVVIGDAFAGTSSNDPLADTVQLRGIAVTTDPTLGGAQISSTPAGVSGIVQSPSTATVYVNGTPVQREDLPPGPFSISGIPVANGVNNVQVVLQDAFGRTQSIGRSVYGDSQLLRRGEHRYTFAIGTPSETFGAANESRSPSAVADYSLGVTASQSVNARVERSAHMYDAAIGASLATRFGAFHAQTAFSRASGASGFAYDVNYAMAARGFSLGASLVRRSPAFATLAMMPEENRPTLEENVSLSMPIRNVGGVALTYSKRAMRDVDISPVQTAFDELQANTHSLVAQANVALRRIGFMSLSLGRSFTSRVTRPIVAMDLTFARRGVTGTDVSIAREVRDGQSTSTITIDHPVPEGQGVGYRALLQRQNASAFAQFDAEYHGARENVDLSLEETGAQRIGVVNVAGGIGIVAGHVFTSRPLDDSFALIDVGLPNVRVYANNQLLGRSDRRGQLVVPRLFSYQRNEIHVEGDDMPADTIVDHPARYVTPALRSGTYVSIGAHRVRAFVGKLVVIASGKRDVPAYGQLSLIRRDATLTSDIGEDGAFYIENGAPGDYAATIRYARGVCVFTVRLPQAQRTITSLGELRCEQR